MERNGRVAAVAVVIVALMATALTGCNATHSSTGGGRSTFEPPRRINPADIALPEGYRIEVIAADLTFPTGIAFDEQGVAHVVEGGYSYGEVWTTPRLLRVESNGRVREIARGGDNGPWTGVSFGNGHFYIAEGGELQGGRILRVTPRGEMTVLVAGLPSRGDHHTNGPAVGPDGAIYFAVGTATNAAVVGPDNVRFGWLERHPDFHDTPCTDIRLAGRNFTSGNPLQPDSGGEVLTGAFVPFGTPTRSGQVVRGAVPCSGALLRVGPQGGRPQLVAWGFRNPVGLAFAPDGTLYLTENGYDDRGSRPLWGAPDVLWRVDSGAWYGWPDFSAGVPVQANFIPPGKSAPEFVLAQHPGQPPHPIARLGVGASAQGFDISRGTRFGFVGEAFIAELGEAALATDKLLQPAGYRVVRVDPASGAVRDFAVNKGRADAPASRLGSGGLERPVAARFTPDGSALYVVDFGVMMQDEQGTHARAGSGVLWRVTREVDP